MQIIKAPVQWEQLPSGTNVQSIVEQSLAPWWPKIFGYHLVKLGALSSQISTQSCSINHQVQVSFEKEHATLQADPSHLPFKNHSIDALLASFLLDFHSDPLRILREVDRCLVPAGHLVLVGFNPLSPLVLGKLLPNIRHRFPWTGNFFMPSRVKDWLSLLGYQVIHDERVVYHHLLSDMHLNSLGQRMLENLLPTTGSVYILIARKLNVPLTSITIKDRLKKKAWVPASQLGRQSSGYSE